MAQGQPAQGPEKCIGDYALIGDGQTAALVGPDACIEWLCLPRFDSEACFAAILGDEENGCWKMLPTQPVERVTSGYRDETLIVETCFETASGKARVIDFMPIRGEAPDIVRIVEGIEGEVEFCSELIVRANYGQIHPLVRQISEGRALAISGPNGISLDFDAEIDFADRRFVSRFTLREGEKSRFVLTWFASHLDLPNRVDPDQALEDTQDYWSRWLKKVDYRGEHRDAVVRSLVTLKALIHEPTGGMIAAPTSSLPENPGGSRNWDYRYCWLRDATFALLALTNVGLRQEAVNWIKWLRRAVGGQPIDLQPFFTVDGGRQALEWEADWLAGFNGAKPVRFGNGAAGQLQLDIYGEVIDALFQASKQGISGNDDSDHLIRLLASRLEELWEQPDAGIWESRGKPRHHTYSKAMCWVAFDRAAAWFGEDDEELSEHYRQLAEKARKLVCEHGFHRDKQAFVRAFDDDALDCAVLRLPLVGLLPADDPRMLGTVAAIERELCHDGLVRRYGTEQTDDGCDGEKEGGFVAACYWLAEVYYMQGREADAKALFERVTGRANHFGLLAEELALTSRRQLGNFPQGLSHLSLVSAAQRLFRPGGEQAQRAAECPQEEGHRQ